MEPFLCSRPFQRDLADRALSRTSLEGKSWSAMADWFCCCPRAVQDSQEQLMDQSYPSHLCTLTQQPKVSQTASLTGYCLPSSSLGECLSAKSSRSLSNRLKITAESLIFPQNLFFFSCHSKGGGAPHLSVSWLPYLTQLPSYDDSAETCLNLATSLHNSLEIWLSERRELWS